MVNFYNDVMALKASKDEIDRSREYLIMQGFKVEEPRHGLPSVREQAAGLRDITPDYSDNWFVKGTKHDDVSDRVEETLDERTLGLRFDKKRRDAYNRQLELMTQVAPSTSNTDLGARPFWRPAIVEGIIGGITAYLTYITGQAIRHTQTNNPNMDIENLTSVDNLPYIFGAFAVGALVSKTINNCFVNSNKIEVREEVSNLVEALKETPQRIKLPKEG